MVAFVLSLLWRHIGSVREGVRVLNEEGLLWTGPMPVSAASGAATPAQLAARAVRTHSRAVLPAMQQRWHNAQRPLPEALAWATAALFGGAGPGRLDPGRALQEGRSAAGDGRQRAGRTHGRPAGCGSLLPRKLWYEEDSKAHDQTFWEGALAQVEPGMLLLFDLGFVNHALFDPMSQARHLLCHPRQEQCGAQRDSCCVGRECARLSGHLGQGQEPVPADASAGGDQVSGQMVSLPDQCAGPAVLPTVYVVALYWQRWRIEEAYLVVKRLLGSGLFRLLAPERDSRSNSGRPGSCMRCSRI